MTIETVLAGLDLGPTCQPVADFARRLAPKLSARLVYLHAEDDRPMSAGWAELALEAERYRKEAASRYAGGASAQVVWRTGPPAAALQDEAERVGAGLIVAGTGAFGEQPFLGATALKMLRAVTLPLCLVPTHTRGRASLTSGRILAPIDVAATDLGWLRALAALASSLGGPLELLHVVRPPRLVAQLGRASAARLPELMGELLDGASATLRERAIEAGLDHAALRVVAGEDPAGAILEEAAKVDADLIALPAHHKSPLERLFVGSTTEKLASRADRPVLIFPARFGA